MDGRLMKQLENRENTLGVYNLCSRWETRWSLRTLLPVPILMSPWAWCSTFWSISPLISDSVKIKGQISLIHLTHFGHPQCLPYREAEGESRSFLAFMRGSSETSEIVMLPRTHIIEDFWKGYLDNILNRGRKKASVVNENFF